MSKRAVNEQNGDDAKRAHKELSLDSFSLQDVVHEKKKLPERVLTVEHNDTVATVMDLMAKHHVLSIPVFLAPSMEDGAEGTTNDANRYLGAVDAMDLVFHATRDALDNRAPSEMTAEQWAHLPKKLVDFSEQKAITVVGHDCGFQVQPYHPKHQHRNQHVPEEESVKRVILDQFVKHHSHRVALFSTKGNVLDIVSQTDVLNLIHKHRNDLHIPSMSASRVMHTPVLRIAESAPVSEAFTLMARRNVRSLAVVEDGTGALVTVISASDVRGMVHDELSLVKESVKGFLQARRMHEHVSRRVPVLNAIQTTEDADLLELIDHFVTHKVHQVFICDPNTKEPVGVISVGDLLRTIV